MDSSVVQHVLDRSWLGDYGLKWIRYVAILMGQLSIGLLVVVIIGEVLADRRGDMGLFDRSSTLCTTLHTIRIIQGNENTCLENAFCSTVEPT